MDEILNGINIEPIIRIISHINAQLYLKKNDQKIQFDLLRMWLVEQSEDIARPILNGYLDHCNQYNSKSALFSTHYLLDFLHDCLVLNGIELESTKLKIRPETLLKILKGYVFNVTQKNQSIKVAGKSNDPEERFRENTWPLYIGQYATNLKVNYFTTIIKSKCFFDFFQFELEKEDYVERFLSRTGCNNGMTYAYRLAELVLNVTNGKNDSGDREYRFRSTKERHHYYLSISLKPKEYRSKHLNSKNNLAGLRSSPILNIPDTNLFYVIDWNFFSDKAYMGLVFDFYHNSGINQLPEFETFLKYKKTLGEMVDRHLFKKLVTSMFNNVAAKIEFDDGGKNGFPDAYIRIGKRIILIEVKDALFSGKVIDSKSYPKIKEEVDKKLNNKKKGTGQIIKQLKILKNKPFEPEAYKTLKLKPRNLIIYPIIVYSDPNFGMTGIDSYLNEQVTHAIANEGLDSTFESIKRLSLINVNFFIESLVLLQKKENRLDKLIDKFDTKIKQSVKRYKRSGRLEDHFSCHRTFEDITFEQIKSRYGSDGYVE